MVGFHAAEWNFSILILFLFLPQSAALSESNKLLVSPKWLKRQDLNMKLEIQVGNTIISQHFVKFEQN